MYLPVAMPSKTDKTLKGFLGKDEGSGASSSKQLSHEGDCFTGFYKNVALNA